jgi:hypothetical protein
MVPFVFFVALQFDRDRATITFVYKFVYLFANMYTKVHKNVYKCTKSYTYC